MMQIFKSEEFGEVRTCQVDNQIMFVGSDVAKALGYTNTQKAIRDHVDDEDKLTERFVLSGQKRKVVIINESGLYSLILSSKLERARQFKRWVTSEVLPQIRMTGRYELTSNALKLLGEKAEYCDEVLLSVSCFTMTQVAKELDMSVWDLTRLLMRCGIVYWQSGQYMLYADYARLGYAKTRTDSERGRDGRIRTSLRLVWTEAGRRFIHGVVEMQRAIDEHLNVIEFC